MCISRYTVYFLKKALIVFIESILEFRIVTHKNIQFKVYWTLSVHFISGTSIQVHHVPKVILTLFFFSYNSMNFLMIKNTSIED